MKYIALLIIPFALCSCPAVDVKVDTRGATATQPDNDGDGIPDEIQVGSEKVSPVINEEFVNDAIADGIAKGNEKLGEIVGQK